MKKLLVQKSSLEPNQVSSKNQVPISFLNAPSIGKRMVKVWLGHLGQDDSSTVALHSKKKIEPSPSDVMVFQRRNDKTEVANVLNVLLFVAFVAQSDGNFWYFNVDEQLVLFGPFLQPYNSLVRNFRLRKTYRYLLILLHGIAFELEV